jgi:hypothetical protein
VTEAIFTGKQIEELSANNRFPLFTAFETIIVDFPENLFMCESPGDTCYGHCQNEQPDDLLDKHRITGPLLSICYCQAATAFVSQVLCRAIRTLS